MSDEHLYFKMEEISDEMMVIDATGLGSELEIATESEEPPLIMHLSNLPIRDGLDIGHDGGGNETSDNDSLESYLQSPNQTYEGLDLRYDEDGSSSDGSVEYPSFPTQSSHLSFKGRLEYTHEEHGYVMSDEDSTLYQCCLSTARSTKSSNFNNECRMDMMPDKGEKSISSNYGVSCRPFIIKIPSVSVKNTIDSTHDKDECKNTLNTSLNNLPNNAEISCPVKKEILEHKQDEGVVETLKSDSAKFSFSSNISSLRVKDKLSNIHQDTNVHIDAEDKIIKSSSTNMKLPISNNDNLSSIQEGGGETISDNILEHKSLKLSHLSYNNEIDPKYEEERKSASDNLNINAKNLLKSVNSRIQKIFNMQNETSDKVPENCKLELSPLTKKSFSLPTENKLDILHDENFKLLSRQSPSMSIENELNLAHREQNNISSTVSLEPALIKTKFCTMPKENLSDLYEKSISISDKIHCTTSDYDDDNTSSLNIKQTNLSFVDSLNCKVSTEENRVLEDNCIVSSGCLPSDNRLNFKHDTGDIETLNDNTLDITFAIKLPNEPIKENQKDSIQEKFLNNDLAKFTSSLLSENKLNIICNKDNNEILSGNTTELSFKSPSIASEKTLDCSSKRDKISNNCVGPLPFSSDMSNLLKDDKLKIKNSKDDNTSLINSILDTELFETKLYNECEKDVKAHEKAIINLNEKNADMPPLIMKSSNVNIDNELDFMHDRGSNESSDEENAEPRKKRKKGMDSSNIKSKKKVRFDSDNSASYDGFNCQFLDEKKIKPCSEMDYDNIADNLNSNHTGMMEFDILDEFESNDNDNDDRYSDCESDISLDELDAMLEAGFQNPPKANKEDRSKDEGLELEEKEKVILKVRGKDHFDVLPEGWVEVTHNSGMPIFLHRASRVCCVSKPYFLGPGSTRKHEIPISAIPCLNYLRELEKEKNQAQEVEDKSNGEKFPPAKLECVRETKESGSLDYLAVREYCKKRFEFQTITVKRFKTWASRRRHQKQVRLKQRPSLPDNTKLITCPLPPASDKTNTTGAVTKKEFIMNPSGKSPVCILHEYVQHTLRVQPRYTFKELENASTPYGAVVVIGGIEYGSGYGSSKKQAKSEAAKAALDVLIPKMKMFPPDDPLADIQEDVEFFDQVRVEDPRVSELSIKAGQPYPFQILLECLKRNYGMGDTEIDITMKNLKHQKNEFIMKVGKHSVSVICKNKRDGKHRASQAILQLLHPHINTWGSLLRMYGKGSCKTLKEKKEEEQRITELQSQACANKPNLSILRKLKEEMLKYRERMKMKKPIGKLIPEHLELSTSDSNLKNVEL